MDTGTVAYAIPTRSRKALITGSVLLTVLTFFLVALGGLVRNAGAGLACPDWPLCFGEVIPPMDIRVFLEWSHRLIAGTVGVLLAGLSIAVFMSRSLRATFGRYFAAADALLLAQVVLGGMTVIGLLNPAWVSSHLAVGLALWGLMLVFTLKLNDDLRVAPAARRTLNPRLREGYWFAAVVVALIYGQIILGGLVSSNYAGLACPDFPTCHGQWVPTLEGPVALQFFHRFGALVTTVAIVGVSFMAVQRGISRRGKWAALALPVLLTLQILLGIGSVAMALPLLMSVAHLATAAAIFGSALVVAYEIKRS